jgi:hypothetical protein
MPHDHDDFFVGYLPVPARQRRFNRWIVRSLMVIVVATAALVAAMQRDPGDATWDPDEDITVRGLLLREPYPMLRLRVGRNRIATVPIVGEGKLSAAAVTAPHVGKLVELRCSILQRGQEPQERWMIELKSTADAVTPLSPSERSDLDKLPLPAAGPGKPVQLVGEIIDPKCYLGAMKPGDGKTHKACAILCLRGGIPPMFVTHDRGRPRYVMLTDANGAALTGAALERLLPFVGDRVRIEGVEATVADVAWLRIDDHAVTRLD